VKIGEKIRELRENYRGNGYTDIQKMTQSDLGGIINVAGSTIGMYEQNRRTPDDETSIKLADFFKVSLDDLYCRKHKFKSNSTFEYVINTVDIPILGKISAGMPLMAIQNIEGTQIYPKSMLSQNHEYFFLRVQGDSMNLKFNDGVLILVQKQETLENGDIGVILVNGNDATVKRFKMDNNFIILEPMSSNSIHQVQLYNLDNITINIIGKVIKYLGDM